MLQTGYTIGTCNLYIPPSWAVCDMSARPAPTVVIGPIKFKEYNGTSGEKLIDVVIGCSLAFSCQSLECMYSRVSQIKRREERLAKEKG